MKPSYRYAFRPYFTLFVSVLMAACSPGDQAPQQTETTQTTQAPTPSTTTAPPPRADLVIRGGTLLDMTGDTANPTPIKGIVIRDGRIDKVIDAGSSEPLPSAEATIAAGSHYIMPGFIDAHVHFRPWLPDASIWKRASSHYGITTLFDTGPCGDICEATGQEANEWIREYKTFMNSSADGPTLYITGRRMDGPNGSHPLGEKVSNRQEISDYLDFLVELGVDGVKVEKTLPPDLRKIVIEEASARGLPVVGHSKDAIESIAAGMKFIEHMWPVTSSLLLNDPGEELSSPQHDYLIDLDNAEGLIQSMVDNGVYINPTMVGRYGYFADVISNGAEEDARSLQRGGLYADMPERYKEGVHAWWARGDELEPELLETYKEGYEKVKSFLKMFSEAGGKVLAATDAGDDKLVGVSLHREMKMLADAGITPYKVLLGATRWPAEMTRKDDIIGTIEEGKNADIIILGSNPVENLNSTRDIEYVIKDGMVLRSPDDCSVIIPPVSMSCNN